MSYFIVIHIFIKTLNIFWKCSIFLILLLNHINLTINFIYQNLLIFYIFIQNLYFKIRILQLFLIKIFLLFNNTFYIIEIRILLIYYNWQILFTFLNFFVYAINLLDFLANILFYAILIAFLLFKKFLNFQKLFIIRNSLLV